MISHELSTIQQNAAAQDWLRSLPGYVEPSMEGLDSPFRVPYLPLHTSKAMPPRRQSYIELKAREEAELADKIRALVDQGYGITSICRELALDSRRAHRIARQADIDIPNKAAFRKEAV